MPQKHSETCEAYLSFDRHWQALRDLLQKQADAGWPHISKAHFHKQLQVLSFLTEPVDDPDEVSQKV